MSPFALLYSFCVYSLLENGLSSLGTQASLSILYSMSCVEESQELQGPNCLFKVSICLGLCIGKC